MDANHPFHWDEKEEKSITLPNEYNIQRDYKDGPGVLVSHLWSGRQKHLG